MLVYILYDVYPVDRSTGNEIHINTFDQDHVGLIVNTPAQPFQIHDVFISEEEAEKAFKALKDRFHRYGLPSGYVRLTTRTVVVNNLQVADIVAKLCDDSKQTFTEVRFNI